MNVNLVTTSANSAQAFSRIEKLKNTTPEQWKTTLKLCHLLTLIPNFQAPFLEMLPKKAWENKFQLLLRLDPVWKDRIVLLMQRFPELREKLSSLETRYTNEATTIDFTDRCHRALGEFLVPNETGVLGVLPHLTMSELGLIVSVGTERSFFDLALCNPSKCEGLVVRDIDPHVKAYVDFNVLLLRIAKNMEHYEALSTLVPDKDLPPNDYRKPFWDEQNYLTRIKIIREITINADIPPKMKLYYLNYLDSFGRIYFKARMTRQNHKLECNRTTWRESPLFEGVKYHKNEHLFSQLQRYAKCGSIIATVGDINELNFLDRMNIAVLDTSNVDGYKILIPKTKSTPNLIVTILENPTKYKSYVYKSLSEPQLVKLENALSALAEAWNYKNKYSVTMMRDILPDNIAFYASEQILNLLTKYIDDYLFQVDGQWQRK